MEAFRPGLTHEKEYIKKGLTLTEIHSNWNRYIRIGITY